MVNRFRPHHPDEYQKLLEWSRGAKSLLEVGSRYGFTLYDLALHSGASRVVGVDLPGPDSQWGFEDSGSYLEANVKKLLAKGIDAHAVIGSSHSPEVISKVKELGPYDFVFIDAGHAYDDVRQDWENFGPLGKRVVFHDIRKPGLGENQALEVWQLWSRIKDGAWAFIEDLEEPDIEEFHGKGSKMGIGRIGSF